MKALLDFVKFGWSYAAEAVCSREHTEAPWRTRVERKEKNTDRTRPTATA